MICWHSVHRFGSSRGLNSAAQRQCHDSLWGAWYSGLQQTVTVIPPYFASGGGPPLHHSADFLSTSISSTCQLDTFLPQPNKTRRILHSRSQELRDSGRGATGTRPKAHLVQHLLGGQGHVQPTRPKSSLSSATSASERLSSPDSSR